MIFLFLFIQPVIAVEGFDASELLEKCIHYHDPDGQWAQLKTSLFMTETRPNGSVGKVHLEVDLGADRFVYRGSSDNRVIVRKWENQSCHTSIDGSSEFSEADAEKYKLNCDTVKWYKDYYNYLWGFPMNLAEGSLEPSARKVDFMGRSVLELRVVYRPPVGTDVWLFYLDPTTHALVGCRFYKKGKVDSGEYITFEDEYKIGTMRLPKTRSWYTNVEDKLLGTDSLIGHQLQD